MLLISIAIGVALYGIGVIQNSGDATLAIAVGTSIGIVTAILTGVFLPHLLTWFVNDPANATAPVATIVSDTLSIVILFMTATIFLI